MSNKTDRRRFLKTSALGAAALSAAPIGLSASSYRRILGANDEVRVAMLGCKRRFGALAGSLSELEGVHVTHVCEVDAKQMDKGVAFVEENMGYKPKTEKDLRKILDLDDVDAVFVAIPDHWHAPATWMALQAGKHVYVEKPCSHNPMESDLMVSMQKEYGKVVQMGNQQRSAPESQHVIKMIHDGKIGHAYRAVAFYSNGRGPLDPAKEVAPPEWLDWDLFQGPAPRAPFLNVLEDYNWHWFWPYGTGEAGNNALHEVDVARWALGVTIPHTVMVDAAKNHFKDDPWVMYDTMDATFKFDGDKTVKWDGKSRNGYDTYGSGRGTVIYGSEGSVYVDRGGYRLYDRGGKLVEEKESGSMEVSTGLGGGGGMTTLHVANFLEAVKKNDQGHLNSPISEGALSTNMCHYANISYRMGNKPLEIDTKTGHVKDKKAMSEYWSREYEKGWEPPRV